MKTWASSAPLGCASIQLRSRAFAPRSKPTARRSIGSPSTRFVHGAQARQRRRALRRHHDWLRSRVLRDRGQGARSGTPTSVSRCVQLPTAVSRNPAMTATTKPKINSCACHVVGSRYLLGRTTPFNMKSHSGTIGANRAYGKRESCEIQPRSDCRPRDRGRVRVWPRAELRRRPGRLLVITCSNVSQREIARSPDLRWHRVAGAEPVRCCVRSVREPQGLS